MAKNKTAKKAEAKKMRKMKGSRRFRDSEEDNGGYFKILRGQHIVGTEVFGKGEVIKSDIDLEKRFKEEGRYKRVEGPDGEEVEDEDENKLTFRQKAGLDQEDDEEEVTAASKRAARKNPRGGHDRSMGAVVDPEEDEDDEEEEDEEEMEASDEEEEDDEEAASEDEEEDEESEEGEDEGEDVTADFKKEAKAASAKVTKVGRTYTIADKRGNPIGKKSGYTRKDDVKKALAQAAK